MVVVDIRGKPGRRWVCLPMWYGTREEVWKTVEEYAMSLLRKGAFTAPAAAAGGTLVDPKFQQSCPVLWQYLTQQTWEDGSPREPSGLTVFVQDGLFKGLLRENTQQLCLWVAATSFFGLLESFERELGKDQPDWRVDRRAGGGVAKKPRR